MDGPRNSPICNSVDRISNLPETLIHNILSCMDMTCVVQTCVLSKRWRHLWTCTPVLNFDSHHHPYQKFIKFVDKVFVLRDGSNIQRVNLVCGRQRNSFDVSTMAASITTWIVAAVRRNVQELYLDTSGVKISRFPQCLFTCNSLIKLELKLGVKSGIIVLPTCVDLPRLTFMKLDSLPSTDVNRLFLKCPVLESLIIEGHLGHMDVQISSWTLKHLRIVDFASKTLSRVKIDAPNLVSLVCRDCISKCYVLENLASLVTADIDMRDTEDEAAGKMSDYAENHWLFLVALSNATEIRLAGLFFHLSLCATGRARGLLAASAKISLQFSNLRVLKVNWYLSGIFFQALGGLLHISPNVESLWIVSLGNLGSHKPDDVDYWAGVSLSSCKLNHLKSVEIRGLLGYYNELKLVEIMFKNAVVLKKMVLFSSKESKRNKRLITFGEKLLKLPKASSNVTTFLI